MENISQRNGKYENSTVLDSDGNEIAKLGCTRKNIPIKIENVPKNLKMHI